MMDMNIINIKRYKIVGYGLESDNGTWIRFEDVDNILSKYFELLYAIETKVPNETRHQTALRYIKETQNRHNNIVKTLKKEIL